MHRTAYYNGKPVWSGIISKLDNSIEEVYPFSTARDNGFHHSFYVTPQGQEKMDNGESQFFFVTKGDDGKTKVETAWRDDKSDALEKALSELLDLSDVTDYDDDTPEYEHEIGEKGGNDMTQKAALSVADKEDNMAEDKMFSEYKPGLWNYLSKFEGDDADDFENYIVDWWNDSAPKEVVAALQAENSGKITPEQEKIIHAWENLYNEGYDAFAPGRKDKMDSNKEYTCDEFANGDKNLADYLRTVLGTGKHTVEDFEAALKDKEEYYDDKYEDWDNYNDYDEEGQDDEDYNTTQNLIKGMKFGQYDK